MGKFFDLCMAFAVLTANPTSAAYYNEDKLELYSRLSQQLRYQIGDLMQSAVVRMQSVATVQGAAVALLNNRIQAMKDYYGPFGDTVMTSLQKTNGYPMNAILLRVSDPYPYTMNAIFWNTVEWNHGINYDTTIGDSVIERTGWYMMEYHVLETPTTYMKMRIRVRRPDGTLRYNFYHLTRFRPSPVFQTFKLEKGDTVDTVTMGHSGNYLWTYSGTPITVIAGISNQLTLRYLGEVP